MSLNLSCDCGVPAVCNGVGVDVMAGVGCCVGVRLGYVIVKTLTVTKIGVDSRKCIRRTTASSVDAAKVFVAFHSAISDQVQYTKRNTAMRSEPTPGTHKHRGTANAHDITRPHEQRSGLRRYKRYVRDFRRAQDSRPEHWIALQQGQFHSYP